VVVVVPGQDQTAPEAHSLARWARALVPIIDSPEDLGRSGNGAGGWPPRPARCAPGAAPRHRAAAVAGVRPIAARRVFSATTAAASSRTCSTSSIGRTLVGLMRFSGFATAHDFPTSVSAFLERQTLIRDPAALLEVTRALRARPDHSYRPELMRIAR